MMFRTPFSHKLYHQHCQIISNGEIFRQFIGLPHNQLIVNEQTVQI